MDNNELYSEIRKLDSKIFKLDLDISDRVFRIWLVMLLAFEIFAMFGLYFTHRAYVDSVDEMRGEIAALQPKAPPQATRVRRPAVR